VLPQDDQRQLTASMASIERLLEATGSDELPIVLRAHLPGDMGWVIERHAVTYHEAYGWDMRFEGLVARICADFIERFDPQREACWIAERGAAKVGSVFLVQSRDDDSAAPIEGVAQLRMLLVEPSARGSGLGRRLVDECTAFARAAGYRKIMLWTNRNLTSARNIYAKVGYRLMRSESHTSFGHDLVGEIWELDL
jgi:GNAT superfamily N-acetyltransferase